MFRFVLSCTVWSGSYYSRDLLLISKCVILYSLSCPLQMSKYVFAQSGWLPSVTKEIFFAKVKICMTTLIELKQVPLQYKLEDSINHPELFSFCAGGLARLTGKLHQSLSLCVKIRNQQNYSDEKYILSSEQFSLHFGI